jgi:hypothetical protein
MRYLKLWVLVIVFLIFLAATLSSIYLLVMRWEDWDNWQRAFMIATALAGMFMCLVTTDKIVEKIK